jgi:hypothetical protein
MTISSVGNNNTIFHACQRMPKPRLEAKARHPRYRRLIQKVGKEGYMSGHPVSGLTGQVCPVYRSSLSGLVLFHRPKLAGSVKPGKL